MDLSSAFGILLLVSATIASTITLTCARVLQDWGWPFFRLCACCSLLTACGIGVFIYITKIRTPLSWQWKWVWLRAIFGAMAFMLFTISSRMGVSPGDAAALASINMVAAAFLGRIFLQEPLQWMHFLAVFCSIVGALLIARPGFLFGSANVDAEMLFGYALAMGAGFAQAGIVICVRKGCKSIQPTSSWFYAFSSAIVVSIVLAVVPYTPLVEDFSFDPVESSPAKAVGVLILLGVGYSGDIIANNAGAKLSPAGISATTMTASSMVFGYMAQLLLFDSKLEWLTVAGAALMFSGAGAMIMARSTSHATFDDTASISSADSNNTINTIGDDENESLASFIASECSSVSSASKSIRSRRNVGAHEKVASTLPGMVMSKTAVLPEPFGVVTTPMA